MRLGPWLALAALAGCSGPALRAGNLPAELQAPSKRRGDINLASIAAPGAGQSRIDAGDLVDVTIASGRNDEEPAPVAVRVSDSGAADIPLVGPVQVGGLEPFDASQQIAAAAVQRGIYRQPHVTLDIKTKAVNRITVMGAVKKPGVQELPRAASDLATALASAGGLTDEAGSVVEIIRQPPLASAVRPASYDPLHVDYAPTPQAVRIDLASPGAPADCRLGDRDMVMAVPREKEMIYVTGLVTKAGQYEMPAKSEVRLLDAVAMAGGISSPVADKVLVIRRVPGRPEPVPIGASLSTAKRDGRENLVLGAGDVVSVEQTPATAVTDTFMKLFRVSFGVASRTTVF